MNQRLWYIAMSLNFPRSSALLAFVHLDQNLWMGPDEKLNISEWEMLVHFEKVNGNPNMTEYQYNPPNSTAALIHWQVLMNLISQLPNLQQDVLKGINTGCFQKGEPESAEGEEEVIGAYSHFHADQMGHKESDGNLRRWRYKIEFCGKIFSTPLYMVLDTEEWNTWCSQKCQSGLASNTGSPLLRPAIQGICKVFQWRVHSQYWWDLFGLFPN